MNSIALLILIIGIIFIIIGYNKSTEKCPPPKIEYRFIPRTFYDEQVSPVNVKEIFGDLFKGEDSWLNKYNSIKNKNLNWDNYFNT